MAMQCEDRVVVSILATQLNQQLCSENKNTILFGYNNINIKLGSDYFENYGL